MGLYQGYAKTAKSGTEGGLVTLRSGLGLFDQGVGMGCGSTQSIADKSNHAREKLRVIVARDIQGLKSIRALTKIEQGRHAQSGMIIVSYHEERQSWKRQPNERFEGAKQGAHRLSISPCTL